MRSSKSGENQRIQMQTVCIIKKKNIFRAKKEQNKYDL